jgi:hypothetical protein
MPSEVRLMIVDDVAPGLLERRHYFYADPLTSGDRMFRAVVEGVYEQSPGRSGAPKAPWLERLRADGIWAIEVVSEPTRFRDERRPNFSAASLSALH